MKSLLPSPGASWAPWASRVKLSKGDVELKVKALDCVVMNDVWQTLDQQDWVVCIGVRQLVIVGMLRDRCNDDAVCPQYP
jgi:hypothetical protein